MRKSKNRIKQTSGIPFSGFKKLLTSTAAVLTLLGFAQHAYSGKILFS
jgi:hypothetical protein